LHTVGVRNQGIIDIDKSNDITKIIQPSCNLRSHLDGVRGIFFFLDDPIMATVSEVSHLNEF